MTEASGSWARALQRLPHCCTIAGGHGNHEAELGSSHAHQLFADLARQGSWDEGAKVDLRRFPECNWTDWRLPTSARPDHYELELFTPMRVRGMAHSQVSVPRGKSIVGSRGRILQTGAHKLQGVHAFWGLRSIINPNE